MAQAYRFHYLAIGSLVSLCPILIGPMVSWVFLHHATSRYSMCHAFRVNRVYGEMLGCSPIRPHEISRSEPLSQSHLLMWFLYNYAEFGFYQQVLPTFCWARARWDCRNRSGAPGSRGRAALRLSFPSCGSIQRKITSGSPNWGEKRSV